MFSRQNNEDENNNKLIESISNSEHGSEDNKSEYDKKLEESDTKVNFAPTNWRQEQEEEVNINEIQKISADQLRENIRKEVELINSTTVLRQTDGFYYYKCSYIFDGLHLENLLLGHEILTVLSSHILFEPTALNPAHISHDDVFIKAGYLKKLIEHNLHFPVTEKFLQTNTYSKTCKLGVKVKAKSANKRDIYYVKLRESLLHLCSGIYDHPQMFPLSKRARKISTSRPSLFEIIDLDGENSTLNQHAETGIFHPPTFHPPTYSVADSNSYNNQPNKFDLYPNNTNNNNNNSSSVSQFINMKKQLALTSHASSSIAPTLDRLSFSSLFKNQNPYMATSSSSQRLVGVDTIDQSVRSQPRYNSGLISSSHLPPAMTSNRQNNSIASANTSRHNDSIGLDGSSSSSDRLVISNEESRATAPAIEQVPDSDDPIQLFRSEMAALSARLYTVELEVARLKAQRIVQIAQFHQQELMFLRQQQQLASHIHPESFEPTDDIADSTLQPQPWLPRPGHVMAVLPPGVSRLSKENMDKAFYFGLTGQNSSQPDHPFSLNPLETVTHTFIIIHLTIYIIATNHQ